MITYNIERWHFGPHGILGDLRRTGELLCFTLEPPERDIHGAIPEGTYPLVWERSPRLNRYTPRLENVPGREGILIHAGNSAKDTEGCILVGTTWSILGDGHEPWLSGSRKALVGLEFMIQRDTEEGGHAEMRIWRE